MNGEHHHNLLGGRANLGAGRGASAAGDDFAGGTGVRRCTRHARSLPDDDDGRHCAFCVRPEPDPLATSCFDYILKHPDALCDVDEATGDMRLRAHISLPNETCERLLDLRLARPPRVDRTFMHIFADTHATRLRRVRLRNTSLDVDIMRTILAHPLLELHIDCGQLSDPVLQALFENALTLRALTITNMSTSTINVDIQAPNLRRLILQRLEGFHNFETIFAQLEHITHLDLSSCRGLDELDFTHHLISLESLVLHNVLHLEHMVPAICRLRGLRHLDVSQVNEDLGRYDNATEMLATLVESLPHLTSLDISGTNLGGTGVAHSTGKSKSDLLLGGVSDIPGLVSRVNNPFNFLGLYETHHDACTRHDIPAKLVAGNANEEQLLVSALAYMERADMLQKVLNELFHLFRYESCDHVGQALHFVLEAMGRHLCEKHIQISGSATLFYIVKSSGPELHDVVPVKRRIITTLLNGMSEHRKDETMLRNGCLTLCQFKIPNDVIFDYERLVEILLHSVYGSHTENFIQRIGIYLLNSLACQIDGKQKIRLGKLGAIERMLWLIEDRLQHSLCDDVLEVAWSTMWNVTDETPYNCRNFLESKGMELFLKCLDKFPNKEELLRNMMGLLGNVAEVRGLRHYLITSKYLQVFSQLLESISDGIEVSYNAAGVLSHIASDGRDAWTVVEPSREQVLLRMSDAIDRWDLSSQRNINYRSFEPILQLLRVADTPECQRWATWALANLTTVYPHKYCELVEKEGGIFLLEQVIRNPNTVESVRQLAEVVISNCQQNNQAPIQLDG